MGIEPEPFYDPDVVGGIEPDPFHILLALAPSLDILGELDFRNVSGVTLGSLNNITGLELITPTETLIFAPFGISASQVGIDIKPGSDPNCFNINGHGVIPVAILGSESFDVTQIDQATLLFGGLVVRVRGNKGPLCNVDYSDGDAFLDLVCHFEDDSTNWNPGEGDATLTGSLFDDTAFEGSDSICIVP